MAVKFGAVKIMSSPIHTETHFTAGDVVRDVVIGMSDGLTVPFALAAGLSGAITQTHLIVTAGLAEIAAGSIAMGLGGYLAARSEIEHYASERRREEREIVEKTAAEEKEIADIFKSYGISLEECSGVIAALKRKPEAWVDFMMRFELELDRPDPRRALASARNIALAYLAGGLIPLAPYMLVPSAGAALRISVVVTIAALAVFGYVKGKFTGTSPVRSALQTTVIGGLAATAAFLIARAIS